MQIQNRLWGQVNTIVRMPPICVFADNLLALCRHDALVFAIPTRCVGVCYSRDVRRWCVLESWGAAMRRSVSLVVAAPAGLSSACRPPEDRLGQSEAAAGPARRVTAPTALRATGLRWPEHRPEVSRSDEVVTCVGKGESYIRSWCCLVYGFARFRHSDFCVIFNIFYLPS